MTEKRARQKGETKTIVDGSHGTNQRIPFEMVWSTRKKTAFTSFLAQNSMFQRREISMEGNDSGNTTRVRFNNALARRLERRTSSELASFSVPTSGHNAMTNQMAGLYNVSTGIPVVSLSRCTLECPSCPHIDKGYVVLMAGYIMVVENPKIPSTHTGTRKI